MEGRAEESDLNMFVHSHARERPATYEIQTAAMLSILHRSVCWVDSILSDGHPGDLMFSAAVSIRVVKHAWYKPQASHILVGGHVLPISETGDICAVPQLILRLASTCTTLRKRTPAHEAAARLVSRIRNWHYKPDYYRCNHAVYRRSSESCLARLPPIVGAAQAFPVPELNG